MTEKMDPETMAAKLAQAVGITEGMRNHFVVFRDAVEALRNAQGVCQALKEHASRLAAMTQEVRALEERKAGLERAIAALPDVTRQVAEAKAELAGIVRRYGE